jgi:lipopolysaccharide/colanic/teichoic acid biosynthesis glycosyltransferase
MSNTLRVAIPREQHPGKASFELPDAPRGLYIPTYCDWSGYLQRPLAAVLIVLAAPVIAVAMLLTRATSPGPALYRQRRAGLRGVPFVIYKIRTMRPDAEVQSGPVWASAADQRTTPVGRLLRAWHIDELPQLYNVAIGDMALVGPRPERPEIAEKLEQQIPGYRERLAVRQGMTGLAQVNVGADVDLNSVRRKLVLDLEYIQSAGLLFDLRILCCTLLQAVCLPRTWCTRIIGVDRRTVLSVVDQQTTETPFRRAA